MQSVKQCSRCLTDKQRQLLLQKSNKQKRSRAVDIPALNSEIAVLATRGRLTCEALQLLVTKHATAFVNEKDNEEIAAMIKRIVDVYEDIIII